jgi:hypothetical protein
MVCVSINLWTLPVIVEEGVNLNEKERMRVVAYAHAIALCLVITGCVTETITPLK